MLARRQQCGEGSRVSRATWSGIRHGTVTGLLQSDPEPPDLPKPPDQAVATLEHLGRGDSRRRGPGLEAHPAHPAF
jgi:hypothetical protein